MVKTKTEEKKSAWKNVKGTGDNNDRIQIKIEEREVRLRQINDVYTSPSHFVFSREVWEQFKQAIKNGEFD